MHDYDVVIVGAGPAGSTAGYILGSYGFKVVIIDKCKFPREKPCAGCITDKTIQLLQRVYGESVESLKKNNILEYESSIYEITFKDRVLLKRGYPRPFYFVDRVAYDNFLLEGARRAGVEVIEGDGAVSYNLLMNEVKTSSGRRLRGRVIIGADGANSVIRRTFLTGPFDEYAWNKNMATAFGVSIPRSVINKDIDHPVIIFGFIDYGYSWVFPNRERVLIGSCGLNMVNRKRFRELFDGFLSFLNIGLNNVKIETHPLPCGGFLKKPIFGNTILIGDAAGLVDPVLGEGIYYAQRSGELSSHAIYRALKKGENLENTYLGYLHQSLFPNLTYALRLRSLLFGYLNRFEFLPLKILLRIFGDIPVEVVHGVRTYRWFQRR
ncbi:MAG: geranylgeranyl reductase family protein [Thermodesulfovibrionia bacterium]